MELLNKIRPIPVTAPVSPSPPQRQAKIAEAQMTLARPRRGRFASGHESFRAMTERHFGYSGTAKVRGSQGFSWRSLRARSGVTAPLPLGNVQDRETNARAGPRCHPSVSASSAKESVIAGADTSRHEVPRLFRSPTFSWRLAHSSLSCRK